MNQEKGRKRECTVHRKKQAQRKEKLRIIDSYLMKAKETHRYLVDNDQADLCLANFCTAAEIKFLENNAISVGEQIKACDIWIGKLERQEETPSPDLVKEAQKQNKQRILEQWKKTGRKQTVPPVVDKVREQSKQLVLEHWKLTGRIKK